MIRIFTADLLPADIIIHHGTASAEEYGLIPGGKAALSRTQFEALSKELAGIPAKTVPGGSSANMLVTLARLLGSAVKIEFLGLAGDKRIADSLAEAGIELLPQPQPSGAEPAISYVFIYADGQRAIATWPGNARDILTPEMIDEQMIKNSDALLVQGSLWHKFDRRLPDRILALGKAYKKALWLTFPTQAAFAPQDAAHFRSIIPQAALLLGNDGELMRVFGAPLEKALAALQKTLAKGQVAFITCGDQGAAVVTAASIDYVPPVRVNKIVNTLGAGDTAFAGFVAGYLKGMPHEKSAQTGVALASEKLAVDGPRLPHPRM